MWHVEQYTDSVTVVKLKSTMIKRPIYGKPITVSNNFYKTINIKKIN